MWEPAGSGPGHLQPRPQQELQAAGLYGPSQQWDQTHQQLHTSGMMERGRAKCLGCYDVCLNVVFECVCVCVDVKALFVCVWRWPFQHLLMGVRFGCIYLLPWSIHLCAQRVLSLCVWILWDVSLQLPHQQGYTKRKGGQEARLISNSSAWPLSSFLADTTETEGEKLNSCAIHAVAYSHTAVNQWSRIQWILLVFLSNLLLHNYPFFLSL